MLKIYTRLFDPFVIFFLSYCLFFEKFGGIINNLQLFLLIVFLHFVLPFTYCIFLVKTKRVGDWDVVNKKQRRKLLGPIIIFVLLSLIFLHLFLPNNQVLLELSKLQFAVIFFFVFMFLLSPFFKASGHVGSMAVIYPFILKILGVSFWWLIFIIILQAVARVKLKKHTAQEAIVGFSAGMAIGTIISNCCF